MTDSIQALWRTAPPERAILLGKGPSASGFLKHPISGFTISANQAGILYPGSFSIYTDAHLSRLPIRGLVIRPDTMTDDVRPGLTFRWEQDVPAAFAAGSITVAAAICVLWGVPELLLVGCDSFDNERSREYAPEFEPHRVRDYRPSGTYRPMNETLEKIAETFGTRLTFYHRGDR